MDKLQRNERIAILLKMLCDSPGKIFTLGNFADLMVSAKSTISEDIEIIRSSLEKFGLGTIETIPGAAGGIKFMPRPGNAKVLEVVNTLCRELSDKARILPGGYLYMLDIIYNPERVSDIGSIFADRFSGEQIDYVITVETKGIPLAFSTARFLNVPLVVVSQYSEVTDGASVNINYVSGSSKELQTMALPLRSLKRGSKILFIDDFMKGGGTAKGILDLANEFNCSVVGIGVLVETAEPSKKLVDGYFSLMTLNNVNETERITDVKPSKCIYNFL